MYYTSLIDRRDRVVTLRVRPEQPDCCPYYLSPEFAAGTLWCAGGALARAVPDDGFCDELATGRRSGAVYVADVKLVRVAGWPWRYGAPDTSADYRIEVTDAKWADGLTADRSYARRGYFENHAYDERGPWLSAIAIGPGGLPVGKLYEPGPRQLPATALIEDPDVIAML